MSSNPFLRPGEHWDPYKRAWVPNLTEAQVQTMWPYSKKEVPKVEPIEDWMEETLSKAGLDPKKAPFKHPEEDAFQLPLFTSEGDLTAVPPKLPSRREQEVLAAQVANLMVMADSLPDNVVLPEHYARFKIEPIRFICENNLNFFQGNIIKYILRYDAKNGLEDLKKAQRYLDMFIKWKSGDPDWWRK